MKCGTHKYTGAPGKAATSGAVSLVAIRPAGLLELRLMIKTLTVSCVQMHWARDLRYNLATTKKYIELAAAAGSRVVLFPETSLTGYYLLRRSYIPATWSRPCARRRSKPTQACG